MPECKYIRYIHIALFMSLALCFAPAGVFSQDGYSRTQHLWREFTSHNAGLSRMSFSFYQLYYSDDTLIDSSIGSVHLETPSKFAVIVTSPIAQKIICDGRYVWTYRDDIRQATRIRMKDAILPLDISLGAALLFIDARKVEEEYTPYLEEESEHEAVFSLIREDHAAPLLVTISKKDWSLSAVIWNMHDTRVELIISNMEKNPRWTSSPFVFKVPEGAELITN